MPDPINPNHYQLPQGAQVIDYIFHLTKELPGNEAVCVGNILRYVSRYRRKEGDPAEHLRKGKWYLEKLIEIVEETDCRQDVLAIDPADIDVGC